MLVQDAGVGMIILIVGVVLTGGAATVFAWVQEGRKRDSKKMKRYFLMGFPVSSL
jgi:hypothetical protein